jgi:hypothetical protein
METQFIVNDKGERTAVVLSIQDYENVLHQQHYNLELTDEYKLMIDNMIEQEENGKAEYISLESIKSRFLSK